jgi:hypothetical protein
MDTVLFTDYEVLVFAIFASAILLVLAVLLASTKVEKGVGRLDSKIRSSRHLCV